MHREKETERERERGREDQEPLPLGPVGPDGGALRDGALLV